MKNQKSIMLSFTVSVLIIIFSFIGRGIIVAEQIAASASFSDNPLITSNRDDLAFCVNVVDGQLNVKSEEVANLVQVALEGPIKTHPRWAETGYDRFPVRVEVDCPSEAYLLRSGAFHPLLSGMGESEAVPVPRVDIPSSFRIHIYIVPQRDIENAFLGTDLRSAPQEMLCAESQCVEVTSAIYLTAEEAVNLEIVQDRLERILSLNLVDILGIEGQDE